MTQRWTISRLRSSATNRIVDRIEPDMRTVREIRPIEVVPASELTRLREGLERTSGIAFALIEFDHILSDSDRPERTWLTDSMTPAEIAGALWDIHAIARDALTHGVIA